MDAYMFLQDFECSFSFLHSLRSRSSIALLSGLDMHYVLNILLQHFIQFDTGIKQGIYSIICHATHGMVDIPMLGLEVSGKHEVVVVNMRNWH